MTDRTEIPGMAGRLADSVTDAQRAATETSEKISTVSAQFRDAFDSSRQTGFVAALEDITRAYPLAALGAAFILGVTFTRRLSR